MNLQNCKKKGKIRLWTRQVIEIVDEIERNGCYCVKREYLEKKNDTMTSYYEKLYQWYTKAASLYIDIPSEAKYPIWLSMNNEEMLQPVEGTVILELEVDEKDYILCNYEGWGYVVNYWYVPENEEDERQHESQLKQCGLHSDDELILTAKGNFYPLLKRKVMCSWGRIFTLLSDDMERGVVATTWLIKKEWIRGIKKFE